MVAVGGTITMKMFFAKVTEQRDGKSFYYFSFSTTDLHSTTFLCATNKKRKPLSILKCWYEKLMMMYNWYFDTEEV